MKRIWLRFGFGCLLMLAWTLSPLLWARMVASSVVLAAIAYDVLEAYRLGYRNGRHAEVESMCETRELAERLRREQ